MTSLQSFRYYYSELSLDYSYDDHSLKINVKNQFHIILVIYLFLIKDSQHL